MRKIFKIDIHTHVHIPTWNICLIFFLGENVKYSKNFNELNVRKFNFWIPFLEYYSDFNSENERISRYSQSELGM